ncbi:MAG TPA: TIGR04063 family PEP-CTERM/XrtA system glycosyltransferase [Casimicrobiaceae bacterium]|nr:TIGR04063 family PEP-CTERM/XrtA system glycosyltransferase [Casimicrobiaceae bacterium]
MRVLHILDHSLPLHSGYAFRTAAILREQRALGFDTLQLTTPRHGGTAAAEEDADGWHFHRTPMRQGLLSRAPGGVYLEEMAATARRVEELVQSFRPDILHAHSPVLNVLPALWVGRRRHIPVVYEVRALWEDAAVDHGTTTERSLRYRASRALESYALRRAAHTTTICEGLRVEIGARGVPLERITVVPNAVDTREFRCGVEPDPALRARLGLDGKTVIGFAGSFYAYEGLDLLIDALALIASRRPDLRLLLIGGGPQEEALKAQASERGLSDRIIFTGRVPHAEVGRYYDLVDLLAYPRYRMRLTDIVTPLKPLEAMAQGRIVVASDVGGHRELVRDGDTGFLFPAGDALMLAQTIESVLGRTAEWPAMRVRARRFVESERTWTRSVARYSDVYGALCSRPRAALGGSFGGG